jgi:hypothetical protein
LKLGTEGQRGQQISWTTYGFGHRCTMDDEKISAR